MPGKQSSSQSLDWMLIEATRLWFSRASEKIRLSRRNLKIANGDFYALNRMRAQGYCDSYRFQEKSHSDLSAFVSDSSCWIRLALDVPPRSL